MNRKFGKINASGGIDYAPSALDTPKGYTFNPSDEDYLAAGWKRISDHMPPSREGGYWTATEWREVAIEKDSLSDKSVTYIERVYEWRENVPTPKIYNKYRLGMAIQSEGLLDALLGFFSANPAAKFHWDNAQDFSDNDENFKAIVSVFVEQFGEDKVAEILKAAEV